MSRVILLALLAAAALYIARLRKQLKARDAAAAEYDAAVLACQARERWEAAVRQATGVNRKSERSTP